MNRQLKPVKDKIYNKLNNRKIKSAFDYVNNSTKMLRNQMRRSIDKCSLTFYKKGISANITSIIGFAIGLLALNFLSLEMYFWALICILANRVFDAIDGGIARRSKITEFGIFLDASLDYIFYTGVIFGFALANPANNAVAAAFLLFGFAASACAMLAYALIAYKERSLTDIVLDRSPFYLGGFAQGAETFIALIIMCLIPSWFMPLAILFGVLCLIKAVSIIITAYYNFVIAAAKK